MKREKTITVKQQFRELALSDSIRALDTETDFDMDFSVSSETPIKMSAGYLDGKLVYEILDHSPSGADLTYLNAGGMFIWAHHWDMPLAQITKAYLDPEKRQTRIQIKWLTDSFTNEKRPDIESGKLPNVSLGYTPTRARCEGELDGLEVWRVSWFGNEVSSMPVAADLSVGIGRGAATESPCVVEEEETKAAAIVAPAKQERKKMTPEEIEAARVAAEKAALVVVGNELQARAKQIIGVAKDNGFPEIGAQALSEGHDLAWVNGEINKQLRAKFAALDTKVDGVVTQLDLSGKEKKVYSVLDGMRRAFMGEKAEGLAVECHNEIAKRLGRPLFGQAQSRSLLIPYDIQTLALPFSAQSRGLNATTGSQGGYMAQTQYGELIELLRNSTMVGKLGATILSGLVGDFEAPRQTGASTAYYPASETGAVTASTQALGLMKLVPHSMGAITAITRRLMLQTGKAAEQFAMNDLLRTLRIEWDRAALDGTGYNGQPLGLLNHSGIGTSTFSSALTWANMLELESDVAAANADDGAIKGLTTAAIRRFMKAAKKDSGSGKFIWDDTGNKVNGYEYHVSENVPSGVIIQGDWSQLVIGEWGVLELAEDVSLDFTSGGKRIRVLQDFDVGVRQVTAFSTITSVTA